MSSAGSLFDFGEWKGQLPGTAVPTLGLCLSWAPSCVPPAHQSCAETDSQKYLRWVVQGPCRTVDFLCPRCLSKTRQSLCWLNFSIETINTPCYTSASIVPHKVVDRTSWQLLESIHLLKDQIWWFLKFALSALPGVKGQLEFTDLWGGAVGCLVVWHQFIKSLIRMSRNMLYLTSLLYLT